MIENGILVTMDKSYRILDDGAIYVEGRRIVDIGKTKVLKKAHKADEVIDASNCVVMPGFINSHVHFTSVLGRGVEDNFTLEQWPSSPSPTKEELAAAFRLVCLEMIKAGVTCYMNGAGQVDERYKSGLRGFSAFLIQNEMGDYKKALQYIQKNCSDRMQLMLGPWWVPAVPEDVLKEVGEVSKRYDLKIRIHTAESMWEIQEIKRKHGCDGSIEYLDKLSLLCPRLIAVHCVHVSPSEINLMKKKGASVIHCPTSNAKLGDGVAPLIEFIKNGITVGLGSDGVATNNCIDMFQEMKFACLLQRAIHCDPKVMKAEDVLRMATIDGARLLGIDSEVGSLEISKKADITIVDFKKPHLYPRTNVVSHLVYSAKASDVDTTIVDGKILMRNRKVLTMDEATVLEEAHKAYESISARRITKGTKGSLTGF